MSKGISIGELAERAGVSPATVSIVLNNRPLAIRVAEPTRERIRKLADELNYRPNHLARSMQRQSTRTISFICGELTNPFYAELVDNLVAMADERGYRLLTQPTHWNLDREFEMLESVMTREVDGIVIFSEIFSQQPERARRICPPSQPLVVLNDSEVKDFTSVRFDLLSGMRELFTHLESEGFRNVALADDRHFPHKSAAYLKICAEFNLEPRIFDFRFGDMESIRDCAKRIASDLPEVLIAASDQVGSMLIYFLAGAGVRMPEDYAAVTIDGTRLAQFFNPALTSIWQDTRRMAAVALEELLRKLEKKDMEIRHLALPTSVRINESTLFRRHRKHLKSDAENLSSVNSKTLSNDKEKESCV